MDGLSGQILAQWGLGALIGLAMAGAFLKAFFSLMADNRNIRQELVDRQMEREERFFLGLLDCINKNTQILEQLQGSLEKAVAMLLATREKGNEE
ncbi:MAG: hypothetical protein NTW86_31880 [Candidatus Sumerlaeota bacterium]|nr:hypothetical protein [Candidatus Sumerlaeota bacterium]